MKLIVFDNQQPVCTVKFKDNLTIHGKPDYVNENGRMGIKRIKAGRFEGRLVYMFVDCEYPERSYAEFIEEKDAFRLCWSKKKYEVIDELDIKFE